MKKVVSLLLISLFFIQCKKENEESYMVPKPDFYPLSVGNYWVYEVINIDSNGTVTPSPRTDSLYISHMQTIKGKQYYIFEGSSFPHIDITWLWAVRDSSGIIVDTNGGIVFNQNDYSDSNKVRTQYYDTLLTDTLYTMVTQLRNVPLPITVPAGTFNVLDDHTTVRIYYGYPPNKPLVYSMNAYYADGVGRIFATNYYVGAGPYYPHTKVEQRLLRYHIK